MALYLVKHRDDHLRFVFTMRVFFNKSKQIKENVVVL
jgi:hypothetical protein